MPRRLVLGVALGVALLLVVDALATRLGAPGVLPSLGPAAWLTSRAAGVAAFVALTLDLAFGLAISTGALDRRLPRARTVELHRWLSSSSLALVAAHAAALLFDRFVRFDALDLLVPFLSSYRAAAVGVGVLAAYGAVVVHASFFLRRRLGARAWRRLHGLSFAVFASALVHGLAAGSDAAALAPLYLGAAALIGGLVIVRLARLTRAAAAPR